MILLHLGHGGIQKSVVKQANILSNYFEVAIVSIYKLKIEANYNLSENVKVTYLNQFGPNKVQFMKALRTFNLFKIFKESIISLKILFYKTYSLNNYLKQNNNLDIVISTRVIFNKSVSRNCKDNVIKIAEEHQEHLNNKRYLKKMKKNTKDFDWLLPVSKSLTSFYSIFFKENTVKVKHMPNSFGVSTGLKSSSDSRTIVSVGRMEPEKAFEDLLKVLKILQEKTPDWNAIIIGNGSQLDALKNYRDSLNLQNNVSFIGYQPEEKIFEYLSSSAIFVMCSLEESFGISLLEALSVGLPSVVFDSANGFKEILDGSSAGVLISGRSIQKMADSIFTLLQNKNLREKMSEEGIIVSERYTDSSIEVKLISFFRNEIGFDLEKSN